jgi:hypothetical protein
VKGGITSVDSLWFHMPQAARFVQEGWTTHLHYAAPSSVTPFYPNNFELCQALAILPFHHEFLAPLLNLGALGVTLLAAWCIGRPYGASPLTLTAAALVPAAPIMALTQPGAALNDLAALGFYLAAIALVVNSDGGSRSVGIAGVAAGIALGTKITMIVPVVVLSAAVAVTVRRPRSRTMLVWAAGLCLTGAYWYTRNLVDVGSPLPLLKLGLDPIALSYVHYTSSEHRVLLALSSYITDADAWRRTIAPGLAVAFTRAWVVIIALAGVGIVTGLVSSRRREVRLLALVALVCAAAYVFSPNSGYVFLYNLRAAIPGLALGLLLVALRPRPIDRIPRSWLLAALAVLLLAVEVAFIRRWHPAHGVLVAVGAGVAVGVATGSVALHRSLTRSRLTAAATTGAALVALGSGGWWVQRQYLRTGYAVTRSDQGELVVGTVPRVIRVYRRLRPLHHAQIGTVGFFENYPLYGRDLSNRVRYVANHGHLGVLTPIRDCRHWIRALQTGRYQYIVAAPWFFPFNSAQAGSPEAHWTRAQPNVRELLRDGAVSVFRIQGALDPSRCDPASGSAGPTPAAPDV